MRLPSHPYDTALLSTLLFPLLTSAFNIDCHHVRVAKKDYDLSELGGPRSVLHSVDQGLSFKNTTYTIDICRGLTRKHDVPKDHQCPFGTRVCGIERLISKEQETDTLERVIPIAGELKDRGGGHMDARWELLGSSSSSHEDAEKEGIRVNMEGGFSGTGQEKRPQKAIIEFLCDRKRTGLENLWTPEKDDQYEDDGKREEERSVTIRRNEDDDDNDGKDDGDKEVDDKDKPSLEFIKYDVDSGDADILRLRWRTQYACEGAKRELEKEKGKGNHWGFFTWFILIAFLSTATYLIFGSWLNYNRYGARGWDLLPHGDTIRDAPYLLKDWSRRVFSTVQGPGSRGGYAAV